jgi:hypothetical protein
MSNLPRKLNLTIPTPEIEFSERHPDVAISGEYRIYWERVNGGTGKGKSSFRYSEQEAERLADELNEKYPNIKHTVGLA